MLFEVDGERFEVGNLEELKGYLAAGRTNEKYDLEIVGPMPEPIRQQGEHHGQR
jgi:hypothetical protein